MALVAGVENPSSFDLLLCSVRLYVLVGLDRCVVMTAHPGLQRVVNERDILAAARLITEVL